jgi:hypothetical protein
MPKMMKKGKMYAANARGMSRGGMQAASVGGDIGQWVGDWLQNWLGFARGGEMACARGGMMKRGHSVFH